MSRWLTAVAVYLFAINVITFATFAYDKSMSSRSGKRRIRERTLLLLALIGGSPGALLAMKWLRHKTIKQSFRTPMFLIVFVQIAAAIGWLAWPA